MDKSKFFKLLSEYLNYDWSHTLYKQNIDNPQYLGLIGLQIYAAHLMDEYASSDNAISENAYNPRLCELLGLDINGLQQLYKSHQDMLWDSFSRWCKQNGFEVGVPFPKIGPGRYSQYPLSQATLNKKDLRHLALVFVHAGLNAGEEFYFPDFVDLFRHADVFPRVTKHYLKIKERLISENKEDVFYRQIFNYYNSWDGLTQISDEHTNALSQIRTFTSGRYTFIMQSDLSQLVVWDENSEPIESFLLNDPEMLIHLRGRYRIGQNGILCFIENEGYDVSIRQAAFPK